MFDRRVLNASYSLPPVQLFMALASLMDDEDIAAAPPWVCPDGITIRQTYGTGPAQVGGDLYYRMSVCGGFVLLYDPERTDDNREPKDGEGWEWEDQLAHTEFTFGSNLRNWLLGYILQGD